MSFADSFISRLIPSAFREFLPFVSPSGLRVVHKEKVLSLAVEIATRMASQSKYAAEVARIETAIKATSLAEKLTVVHENGTPLETQTLSAKTREKIGETVLELYFFMVREPVAFFLDLRPQFFSWDEKQERLLWRPSRLWYRSSAEFSLRIQDLYRGFFLRDENATESGISLYRWEARPKSGFDDRMEVLMRKHFGDAESEKISFSISHFRETFHLIFEEAIESGSRFHPELTFIGTALAGLYCTLEAIQEPLDVAKAYGSKG